jgi:hypothetical protein
MADKLPEERRMISKSQSTWRNHEKSSEPRGEIDRLSGKIRRTRRRGGREAEGGGLLNRYTG